MNPYPNRRVGIPCWAQPDGRQQTPSEKTKMPRDGARVRRCSRKASLKRSTIKCVRHPGQTRTATNQSHNSRARRSLATCEVLCGLAYSAARAGDDDLVFDSMHEVFTFCFLFSPLVTLLKFEALSFAM